MPDLVVTVPKTIWLEWIDEGDPAGVGATGTEWGYWVGRHRPPIDPGDRLYIVAWGRLRGYAPVTRVAMDTVTERWAICRTGGAVAVTIPEAIPGFRGYRRVWWDREAEKSFKRWRFEGVAESTVKRALRAGILDICLYCGRPEFMTRDHIIPVSAGGKGENNIFPVCQACNLAKGSCSWPQWLAKVKDLDGLERRIREYAVGDRKGLRWTLPGINVERQHRVKIGARQEREAKTRFQQEMAELYGPILEGG